ncbi:uncharacterized protein LOC124634254 isoform X2 [Helicoverpa zea]|uniref:uncharacterized protein LOC124634254 isoform X2 n=1 Tax=Helicoverpa zea TaxID=7113 RepID=UPI001F57B7E4|nr:uncharacterized protein LOC124634254 isoform X2 [Helicoverpa zea]
MSGVTRDEVRQQVSSVGNSWIVCKSKSHPGYVYYFNSLTGEAAWNLSDAEIEKAKCQTKRLQSIPGAKPTKFPEPKDNPPRYLLNNLKAPHTPLIINKVTEQQPVFNNSNFGNSNGTLCTNLNQVSGVLRGTQINNPTSVKPVHMPFNQPIGTYSLNNTTLNYNPKVWDVPPTQQIFVAPTMTPLLNHTANPVNVSFNNLSQPIQGLFFNNAENVSHNKQEVFTRESRTHNPRERNYGQRVHRGISKKCAFPNNNSNNLRQKIGIRKRFYGENSSFLEGSGNRGNARQSETSPQIDAPNNKETGLADINTGTMEELSETRLQEAQSKLNVMPLKCLAPPDANLDAWFILVDLGVLLNEFKFLTVLTDSDEKCHLMVPKRVMEELKTYVSCTGIIQARRILRFLSQQIEIGYACMAEEPSNVNRDDMADVILKTCEDLLDKKYHVILISDDSGVLTKASPNIHIFSTNEIKNLLLDNSNKQTELPVHVKKPFLVDEQLNKNKNTVPNNTPQMTETISAGTDTEDKEHINGQEIQKQTKVQETQNLKVKNKQDKIKECVVLKNTVDLGIQTNFADIIASTTSTLNMAGQQTQKASAIPQNTIEIPKNIAEKKRKIKLKRSSYNQTPNLYTEKKQFKWRSRRKTAPPPIEQKSSHVEMSYTEKIEFPRKNTRDDIQTDITSRKDPTCRDIETIILDESFGSRESSIIADVRNSATNQNITIDETSTSGIISNSDSNVDAEINSSYLRKSQQQICNGQTPEKPMYKVDSVAMEEYLKMKCDEWVSRFIQIMEEVLSQVLHQDPPFIHKDMPPPWTLHEAAQCVAIKFRSLQDINDAANKLSSLLFNVSDAKGKITMNITPYQYMQMYSYGMHLLVAIKRVSSSCEDIQVAVELLNKLLYDIRNPNMDDSFIDNTHENVSGNDLSVSSVGLDKNDGSLLLGQGALQHESVESKKRKPSEKELPTAIKFVRKININSSFFKNSSHRKCNTLNNGNNLVKMSNSAKSNLQTIERKQSNGVHSVETNNIQAANKASKKSADESTKQPNVVRKFTICPELEAKVQSNKNKGHNDEEDYDDDCGEYVSEEEYCSEEGNNSLQHNGENISKTNGVLETNRELTPTNVEVDPLIADENTKRFKYIASKLLQEIKKALCEVRILCNQCYKELEKSEQSSELKCELQKMVERAHLHIIRLCRSLERSSVAKSRNQANEFLNSIRNVISAFNT